MVVDDDKPSIVDTGLVFFWRSFMDKQRFRRGMEHFYVADFDALPTGVVAVFVPRKALYTLKVACRYIRQRESWVDTIVSDVLYQPPDDEDWDSILSVIDEMEGYLMSPYERVLADVTLENIATYIDITGLNYNETGPWELMCFLENAVDATNSIYWFINSLYTETSYYNVLMYTSGSGMSTAKPNNPLLAYLTSYGKSMHSGMVGMDGTGYVTYMSVFTRYGGANVDTGHRYISHAVAQDNITSIRIASKAENGLDIGTRIILLRRGV